MTHPVPFDALDGKVGILGITGSGKTHTAIGLVELLLDANRQVIIIDPTGAYGGLRSSYPIPIFGGKYGDVQISEEDGEAVARVINDKKISAIVDVSPLLKHSHESARRFMAGFVARLKDSPGAARYLVIDEADEFMPENVTGGMARLFGNLKWIVRRGRIEGWRVMMVTQRPQDIAKSVLDQCETLIVHQLTSPRDRKAVELWVKGNVESARANEVLQSLTTLATGQAWVWSPRRDVLELAMMPANRSADTSKTPDAADAPRNASNFKKVDVRGLQAALAKPAAPDPVGDPQWKDSVQRADKAGRESKEEPFLTLARRDAQVSDLNGQLKAMTADRDHWRDEATSKDAQICAIRAIVEVSETSKPAPHLATISKPDAPRVIASRGGEQEGPASITTGPSGPVPLSPGNLKKLAPLAAAYPGGLSESQWAISLGVKRSTGSWSNVKSALRVAGAIEQRDGRYFATEAGAAMCGDLPRMPAPGLELVAFWAGKVGSSRRILDILAHAYPDWLTHDQVANALGISPSTGSWSNMVSMLNSNGLIQKEGRTFRAHPDIMEAPNAR